MAITTKSLEDNIFKLYTGGSSVDKNSREFILEIPGNGLDSNEILLKLHEYLELGKLWVS